MTDPTAAAPNHRPAEQQAPDDWWRNAVVYQIYPRSFADGSGDGIGDLSGITSRLGALAELGVDAVWLSPFFTSPQADAGYDVADYRDVDPLFGTLADFDALLARAHELDLRVIIDLVPNHSSDEHPWFRAALAAAPGSPERARYTFRDGSGPDGEEPPNNWLSIFGGIGWTRVIEADGRPGQWYLHMFDVKQPDWDWTNEDVREEFRNVLRFWLDRGVDGFRVDVANSLVKMDGLPDYDPTKETGGVMAFGTPDGDALVGNLHTSAAPMWDQEGVHEIYRDWRLILDKYSPARILVAEAWVQPLSRLARYVRPDEMHQAFNFEYLSCPWSPVKLREVITASLAINRSVGAPTTWVLSNHDVLRHPTRFGLADQSMRPNGIGVHDPQPDAVLGLRRGRAGTLTMLALPGSAYLYQGEELGLPEHTALDDNLREDPTWVRSGQTIRGRDGCRVPLPWESDRPGLGFGPTGATWLPQPASFAGMARDVESADPESTLQMYRAALRLRREHRLGDGDLEWLDASGSADNTADDHSEVVAFRNSGVTVIANMGASAVDLPRGTVLLASESLPGNGTLPGDTTVWLG